MGRAVLWTKPRQNCRPSLELCLQLWNQGAGAMEGVGAPGAGGSRAHEGSGGRGQQRPWREAGCRGGAGFPQRSVGAMRCARGRKGSGARPLSHSVGTGAPGAHKSALCKVKGHGPSKGPSVVRVLKAKSRLMPGCTGLCVQRPLGKKEGQPVGRTVTVTARRRAVVSQWRAGDVQSAPLATSVVTARGCRPGPDVHVARRSSDTSGMG